MSTFFVIVNIGDKNNNILTKKWSTNNKFNVIKLVINIKKSLNQCIEN